MMGKRLFFDIGDCVQDNHKKLQIQYYFDFGIEHCILAVAFFFAIVAGSCDGIFGPGSKLLAG